MRDLRRALGFLLVIAGGCAGEAPHSSLGLRPPRGGRSAAPHLFVIHLPCGEVHQEPYVPSRPSDNPAYECDGRIVTFRSPALVIEMAPDESHVEWFAASEQLLVVAMAQRTVPSIALRAIDIRNHGIPWRRELTDAPSKGFWMDGDRLLIASRDRLLCVDGNTGREVWGPFPSDGYPLSAAWADGGTWYLKTSSRLTRMDGRTGEIHWTQSIPHSSDPALVTATGVLDALVQRKSNGWIVRLQARDLDTGEIRQDLLIVDYPYSCEEARVELRERSPGVMEARVTFIIHD